MSACLQMLFNGCAAPSCPRMAEAQAGSGPGSSGRNPQPAEVLAQAAYAAEPAHGVAKRKRKASAGAAGGTSGFCEPCHNPTEAPASPATAEAEPAAAKRARSGPDPAVQSAQVVDALKVTPMSSGLPVSPHMTF